MSKMIAAFELFKWLPFRPYARRFISHISVPPKKGLNSLPAFVRGESDKQTRKL